MYNYATGSQGLSMGEPHTGQEPQWLKWFLYHRLLQQELNLTLFGKH